MLVTLLVLVASFCGDFGLSSVFGYGSLFDTGVLLSISKLKLAEKFWFIFFIS